MKGKEAAARILAVCVLAALAAACSTTPEVRRAAQSAAGAGAVRAVAAPAPRRDHGELLALGRAEDQRVGNPYQVSGISYTPQRDDSYDQTGIASWYGPGFHGRLTANGETYDQDALTAAHPTLPLPSIVEVTNLENGRTVRVRVNDRGPFARGRIIDMSHAGARELGFIGAGTARVRVRYVGPASYMGGYAGDGVSGAGRTRVAQGAAPSVPPAGPVAIQAGAFSERANAEAMVRRLSGAGSVWVQEARVNGRPVFRVMVGPWSDHGSAVSAQARLRGAGVYDSLIVALQ